MIIHLIHSAFISSNNSIRIAHSKSLLRCCLFVGLKQIRVLIGLWVMASSCVSSVTISEVGSKFVQHYYEVLQHQPRLAHRFYTASSTIIRVDGESTEIASDISEIQKLVESLHLSGVEFKTINSVESGRRGITVVVSGSVKSDCFTGCRKFVETFFLAPHEKKGYLVINDIFHFVSEKHLSDIICTRDSAELLSIWRNNRESLEDFLFRFIRETMRFPEAIDQLKIAGFIQGVCDDKVVFQLRYPKLTQKFETLIQQVTNLVMVERLCAFNKEDEMRRSARPNNRKRKKFSPYRPKSWMGQPITFPAIYTRNYQGPFVITATIADYRVHRIHIDEGSASEILFESFFDQMDEEIRENLTKGPCPLVRFSGEMVRPLGQIQLPVIIGEEGRSRTLDMTFSVVRAGVSPNVIIGRSGIRALHAVVSTIHGAMKFPTPNGIATILSGN